MSDPKQKHWHHLTGEQVLRLLATNGQTGLDRVAVEERQHQHGPNSLARRVGDGPLLRFLLQFNQALVYILLIAVIIKLSLGAFVDAAVIFGVVLLNSIIGFVQEGKALNALEALSRTLKMETTVLRAGEKQRIDAAGLVPGDIVLLASGDKVPADLFLLRSRSLQIDESALTGESVPVDKFPGILELETPLADRTNLAYSSTLVTYGTGVGVVVATGDSTEIGRISELIASAEVIATPLTRKIADFSRLLLYAILGLAALTFAVGLWHGQHWVDLFMAAVALSVAMIPEGLPAVLTITLAIGVARMAERNAIIRRLPAVETLGSTTVVCSDKTGTITRNEMTVQRLWVDGQSFELSGIGYAPEGELRLDGERHSAAEHGVVRELLRAGLLCNDAVLKRDGDAWRIEGDPTEGALLVAASKAGLDARTENARAARLETIPFESQHQYMVTLHGGDNPVVYLKGSVEKILERCTVMLGVDGSVGALDADEVLRQVNAMAGHGLRVLAFARMAVARGTTDIDHQDVCDGLTFLGLQGMIDPPREEAIHAVRACQEAGIKVKMITGDHAATAAAIAGQIGLLHTSGHAGVLTGRALEEIPDADLIDVAAHTAVFARVTPEQKLRLVEALQARGEVVAMTGDGVNDAPALRRADIGVAMGITGTDVSKEAADMVLTDDNFATIEAAVEEGRGVFDNLIKFITWILPTNAGQGLVIIAAVMAAQPLPVLPVQALWINMTTAVLLGLTLAFEPRERDIMSRPPRLSAAPILNGELIKRILLVGLLLLVGSFGLFEWALYSGRSEQEARTIAVNVFAVGQSFYLLNCRSLRYSMFRLGLFSNPWIWAGIGAMMAVQLLFTYIPLMNKLFHTAPIGWIDWGLIVAVGLAIYLVIEGEKAWRRRGASSTVTH